MVVNFQDLNKFDIYDVEAAIRRNSPDEMPLIPITLALSSSDPVFVMNICSQLALHPDPNVRGNAIISLGHLARRFRNLDESLIKPLIENALRDDNEQVRHLAKSAADEIHQFMHWTIGGHIYG